MAVTSKAFIVCILLVATIATAYGNVPRISLDQFCRERQCVDRYFPVCASDGQTYRNGCLLSLENCDRRVTQDYLLVEHVGECGSIKEY
ncbi:turripeptide Ici9.2 [Aplysia californica]|uniref:Turripeptide Ici9.2 n=1 Tax=Aplysia californica TaxID=6500 RepID=A0ABM0K2D7_APLCA|nr:turripeptide Ici9.2 [Aplysia californica]